MLSFDEAVAWTADWYRAFWDGEDVGAVTRRQIELFSAGLRRPADGRSRTGRNMKVVILAGGFGTRLAEETITIPKPMVQIGEHPMLWHIMKFYASYGFAEFVVALGYQAEVVKNFFLHFADMASDLSVDLALAAWNVAAAIRRPGRFISSIPG